MGPVLSREADTETMANTRRRDHAQIADDVLQYLAAKGSPIKLLAFSLTLATDVNYLTDPNGHEEFPCYYYVKGSTSIACFGAPDIVKVAAVPVKEHEFHTFAWSPILPEISE